ncbi:MAG: peptide chain release factor N(5)-glutamine methyltransferase [Ruminiclostridium sp.]|nr:peptide chain release factor N(5)-glutamine methyltransferase [Ruminiclostridium sp.]
MVSYPEIRKTLAAAGVFDPSFEAREILREYTGSELPGGDISPEAEAAIQKALQRRITGEPLQYIFGKWEFYGLPFYVGQGVLIPRPETELLVDIAVKRLRRGSSALDLCSGSGCIPVSIALKTGAKCYAVELHEAAFGYLERNITLNGADVTALRADALDGTLFPGMTFDAIFSNPPYLTGAEMRSLMREVSFEPESALYGGEDGLDFYRKIIPAWVGRLAKGGFFAVETGETQGAAVAEIMRDCGLFPEVIGDHSGLDRVVVGTLKKTSKI